MQQSPDKAPNNSVIEIYHSPEGNIELHVKLENDTVWLTQGQMAQLFGKDQSVVARHIKNAFNEGEVEEKVICKFCIIPNLSTDLQKFTALM